MYIILYYMMLYAIHMCISLSLYIYIYIYIHDLGPSSGADLRVLSQRLLLEWRAQSTYNAIPRL